MKQRPPTVSRSVPRQEAIDLANWIGNRALREGLAVLAIIWDREAGSPAVMLIEGADHVADDPHGGFERRVAKTLLSQRDILDALRRCAIEEVVFGDPGARAEAAPREREQ